MSVTLGIIVMVVREKKDLSLRELVLSMEDIEPRRLEIVVETLWLVKKLLSHLIYLSMM